MKMKRAMPPVVAAVLAVGLLLVPAAFGEDKPKPEQFSAVWAIVGGGAGGKTVPIDIRINRYSTDEEIKEFADILVEGGQRRLREALEKEDVGQLSATGNVGVPIAIARKFTQGEKTIIRVVTVRTLSFVELRYSGRSVDYPFTILQLEVDQEGKGTGTAIGAASIKFNKEENTYVIESLQHGTAYNKLLNVKMWN